MLATVTKMYVQETGGRQNAVMILTAEGMLEASLTATFLAQSLQTYEYECESSLSSSSCSCCLSLVMMTAEQVRYCSSLLVFWKRQQDFGANSLRLTFEEVCPVLHYTDL